ncbi:MAG: esterase-like activity of phytase family protein [Magnetococcus sp. WYHC-3]
MSRRRGRIWAACCLGLGLWAGGAGAEDAQDDAITQPIMPGFSLLGEAVLPAGTYHDGALVGGLSGVDRDPHTGDYWAISDDAARHGPARIYRLRLPVSAAGVGPLSIVEARTLTRPHGKPFPRDGVDGEALRLHPDGRGFWWSSELHVKPLLEPVVAYSDWSGQIRHTVELPEKFRARAARADGGPRGNKGFEALALADDTGSRLLLGMEGPLRQDGDWVRLVAWERDEATTPLEYAYQPDPWTPGTVGLTELLFLAPGRYLALERSHVAWLGLFGSLWALDLRQAENIAGHDSLRSSPPRQPVRKRRVADLTRAGVVVDNLEGMTWGPVLPDGRQTLVVVSDDNFRAAQRTQFLVYTLTPELLEALKNESP